MNITPLESAAKRNMPEYLDVKYYMDILFTFPENEWFFPTNAVNEAFTICDELHQANLIAMTRMPEWKNGSWCGNRRAFLYSKELLFKNITAPGTVTGT
jgi:hypothetical protein